MQIDIADLIASVRLLESLPYVESWQICRITNEQHSIYPMGQGLGLTLLHSVGTKSIPMRIFEKAGNGRTLLTATKVALDRLEQQLG